MIPHRPAGLIIIFLLTTLIVTSAFFPATASRILLSQSLTTQNGSTSGLLSSLGVLDQTDTDDTPSAYLSFSTPATIYFGYTTFQLPADILPTKVSSFLFQVNFKGPDDAAQVWSWSIFNWQSQLWIPIGNTIGTQPNVWNNLTFRVRNFYDYISSTREIRIQLRSNNAEADAKLDYQAIHITYIPFVPTATRGIATSVPTKGGLVFPITYTPLPTLTPTITPSPTSTLTRTPSPTTTSNAPVSTAVFPIGIGGSDVIPHQIVRTDADKLYIFVNQQGSQTLRAYYTTAVGLPDNASAFNLTPVSVNETANILSVDAVYGGGTIIHAIVNTQGGLVKDYPFDTSTNTFKTAITLVPSGSGTISGGGLYVGTSGVAGMVDLNGLIHFTYWTSPNHIMHRAYTYDSSTNVLTPVEGFFQLDEDTTKNANHPSMAVSPVDGKLTVAWVSQAKTGEPTAATRILTRTRDTNGTWGNIEIANTSDAWTSSSNGLNIDQGPSMLIDSLGTKHMVYIEECCVFGGGSNADYGRIHYVTNNGSGWVDTTLSVFTHDPALAISTAGNMYIIGHGHPNNSGGDSACRSSVSEGNMCYIKKNTNGTWGTPVLFATPPDNTFDASPSVKWSAVGWNRPNAVEFIFFKIPYGNPTMYYGRLP